MSEKTTSVSVSSCPHEPGGWCMGCVGRLHALARALFDEFEAEYGNGVRNGYWQDLKPLWERGCEEFGVPKGFKKK